MLLPTYAYIIAGYKYNAWYLFTKIRKLYTITDGDSAV